MEEKEYACEDCSTFYPCSQMALISVMGQFCNSCWEKLPQDEKQWRLEWINKQRTNEDD